MYDFSEEIWTTKYRYNDETFQGTIERVTKHCAKAEKDKSKKDEFYAGTLDILQSGKFYPAGRILYSFGTDRYGTALNCFVIRRPQDDIKDIFRAVQDAAFVTKAGGGIGFNISELRPSGHPLSGGGHASGPVSFLKIFNASSKTILIGSRRAAGISVLNVDHPDIMEWIEAKQTDGEIDQFNISVGITKEFVDALKRDNGWHLKFNDKVVKTIKAIDIFDAYCESAWKYNDPGIFHLGNVNKYCPGSYIEEILAPNPCVARGTLVNTPYGYVKVEDIKVGDTISSLHPAGYERVTSIEQHHNKPIYKVSFSDGGSQLVTGSHVYHVIRGDSKQIIRERLDCLQEGDSVQVHPNPMPIQIDCIDRNSIPYETSVITGILIGDGCYTQPKNSVTISSNIRDTEYNSSIKKLLSDIGDVEVGKDDISRNSLAVKIPIREGHKLIDRLNLTPGYSYEKVIPERYLTDKCRNYEVIGLLEGLLCSDGDANLMSNHPQIRFKTTSPKLAHQIRLLLIRIGIHGRITNNYFVNDGGKIDGRAIQRRHRVYTVNVTGSDTVVLATLLWDCIHAAKRDRMRSMLTKWNPSGGTRKARVLSIEPGGVREVYDLHCEETDTWITEGYVQQGCGEQPLFENTACCLGSINLTAFITDPFTDKASFNMGEVAKTVEIAVRFLDNVLDLTHYPLPVMKEKVLATRRIGLGVMGLGDILAMLRLTYGSGDSKDFIHKLWSTIRHSAYITSAKLGKEKGSFELFDKTKHFESAYFNTFGAKELDEITKIGHLRNVSILTCAPTGCQKPDTMVISDMGILYLDEIVDPMGDKWQEIMDLRVSQEDRYACVTRGLVNGYTDTLEITTTSGIDLECTPNHEYRVIRDSEFQWCSADNLIVGDYIVCKLGGYTKTTSEELGMPPNAIHPNENTIVLPRKLTPELAWFLGLSYADGSIHNKGLRIHLDDEDTALIEKTKQTIRELFEIETIDRHDTPDSKCISLYINSQRLLRYLQINGLSKEHSDNVSIPAKVRKSSVDTVKGFIHGYIAGDGYSSENRTQITTISKTMSQQLAIVMRAVGYNVSIETITKLDGKLGNHIQYRICTLKTGIDSTILRYISKDKRERILDAKKIHESLCVDQVVSIHKGRNMTLDIEVPLNSTYIANSIISHNTTAIVAGNISSGIEPIFSKAHTRKIKKQVNMRDEMAVRTVEDYAWRLYKAMGKPDGETPEYFVEAHDVSWREHIGVQEVIQEYVDNSISKTINMPGDVTLEEYKELMKYVIVESKLKGVTTYIARGDRESILGKEGDDIPKETVPLYPATLKRPVACSGTTYKIPYVVGSSLYVTINSNPDINKRLFEVFIESKDGKGKPWDAVTSRVLSALFRRLPDNELGFLIQELKEIKDADSGIWFGSRYVHSPSHAVAIALEMYMETIGMEMPKGTLEDISDDNKDNVPNPILKYAKTCPECHEKGLIQIDGCNKCLYCGEGTCGK